MSSAKSTMIYLAIFTLITHSVHGHGYLKSPRSRNFVAYRDGVWWGGDNAYRKEDCPQCANNNVGGCGLIESRNYDVPLSVTGDLLPENPQALFQQGEIITVDVVLTAHHMGHFEFKACPIEHGEIPSQECFDQHPLEFVSDPFYGASKDPNYVSRAYIAPTSYPGMKTDSYGGYQFRYNFRLPPTLLGDLVLLQWHYLTANTCKMEGYNNYNFPSEWNYSGNAIKNCDLPISSTGGGAPEQFWNCAELNIVRSPTTSLTEVTPSNPTHAPLSQAPPKLTGDTNPVPSSIPTSIIDQHPNPTAKIEQFWSISYHCGNGKIGNGICQDSSSCCSRFGWCDDSVSHCEHLADVASPNYSPFRPPSANKIPDRSYFEDGSKDKNGGRGGNTRNHKNGILIGKV
mmetsp:Transcript_19349/g.29472  ORF Transcript_19349/g.29472 Transcript_19349/m.29472 type:complete len:400 (-) Transcript_19349:143-1342(-)